MNHLRRSLLYLGILSPFAANAAPCVPDLEALYIGSGESPFFEHYHQLIIPVSALIQPPASGITVVTTTIDHGSYDVDGFDSFIRSSGLNRDKLLEHSHPVKISADQLRRIGRGDKDVEIRVISAAGNYVHNFKVNALASTLVKVRQGAKR